MLDEIQFSEILMAKFCHDIAGQIGAINNSVEFLNEENEIMRKKAHSLIESSAKQVVARLLFFRQAYGISSKIGETNLNDLKELISNFLIGSKLKLDWNDHNISNPNLIIGQKFSKIILNFIIFMQNILIYGGIVKIELYKLENGKRAEILAVDDNWRLDQEIENILTDNCHDIVINTKNVQLYYTLTLMKLLNIKLKIEKNQHCVKFVIEYNK